MKDFFNKLKEYFLHFYRSLESIVFSRTDDKNAKSMILIWKNEDEF